jgi:hypothetical protein
MQAEPTSGAEAGDPVERLGPDDMATRREEEFRAVALRSQALKAAAEAAAPGTCANCGDRCLPLAVYCDPDCRADHERRLKVRARQGGSAR